jgi:glycosyltransferase involved in cell wall biosynthesis
MDSLLRHCGDEPVKPTAYAIPQPIPNRIAYIVSHGITFSSNGYAVRTHGVARGLKEQGLEVLCFTRPGRPWEMVAGDAPQIAYQAIIDQIRYLHTRWPDGVVPVDETEFFDICLELYKKLFQIYRPAVVLAGSNWETALPAYFAARQMNLPFFYEVRGFWEITRMSRFPGWENTPEFESHVARESYIAKNADGVFTLNAMMKSQLMRRGVNADKIEVVPNGITRLPQLKVPEPALRHQLGFADADKVVAYIGSLTSYEGLDDLVAVCAELYNEGHPVKLMVVGACHPLGIAQSTQGSDLANELTALAKAANAASMLVFTGRVSHAEISGYYALANMVVIPRKPVPVCELVTPLKAIEAASYGKAVIASDVAPLEQIFGDRKHGLTFQKGDRASLKLSIMRLLKDEALCRKLGAAARKRAGEQSLWKDAVLPIASRAAAARAERERLAVRNLRNETLQAASGILRAEGLGRGSEIAGATASGGGTQHVPDERRAANAAAPSGTVAEQQIAIFTQAYKEAGMGNVLSKIESMANGKTTQFKAALFLRASKAIRGSGSTEEEVLLADSALATDQSDATLIGFCWVSKRVGDRARLKSAIGRLEQLYGPGITAENRALLEKLAETPIDLLTVLDQLSLQPVDQIHPIAGRICYVLHNTLPYSSGGYATRSHGVAGGLREAGWDVVVLSRPGFPLDIKEGTTAASTPPSDVIDGIPYVRTLAPLRKGQGLTARAYFLAAADALEAQLRVFRPTVVIAASNHITALPAMIAARRLGIPFIYEVRGLWEITRLSRDVAFADTDSFHIIKALESAVAQSADHVFTLTEPMREELVGRGVSGSKIDLLPNSCDPARFMPRDRDDALAASLAIPSGVPVIGYIGTFVDYEGLEDLASACGLLKTQGTEFRLLMVGNENASGQNRGPITREIARIAEEQGFSEWLVMPGRVPHDQVESYYSLIDIAPFPRKPWPVCEMVSPMKPLEALAMEKAVVVSSVRALSEMIADQKTGLVFEKGDVSSLARVLHQLIDSPALRERLGLAGRRWVEQERTWRQVGKKASSVIARFCASDDGKTVQS